MDIEPPSRDPAAVIEVREARAADDLDALNARNPGWHSAAGIRKTFAAAPQEIPTALWVAELDGVPAGYAHAVAAGLRDGHRALTALYVLPEHRGRGVGSALWAEAVALCTPDRVRGLTIAADADDEVSIDIALAHGLVAGGLHLESALDLTRPGGLPDVVVPDGLDLAAMTEADDEPRWRQVCELFNRLGEDAPDFAEGGEGMPYEVFRSFMAQPWQVTLASDGPRLVGLTALSVRNADARTLNTMLTAVDAAYRGRGLATALKLTQARAVAAAGWRSITTQNMDGNAPILAANRRLGFVPRGGGRDLIYDHPAP